MLLTLDPAAQQAAYDGLAALGRTTRAPWSRIDPTTGAILAMVSPPSYDPNLLASHDLSRGRQRPTTRLRRGPRPSRCSTAPIQTTYPPGSTFKLVTAAAALSSGKYTAGHAWCQAARLLDLPQTTTDLHNESGRACGGEQDHPRPQALASRATPPSRRSALELGADAHARAGRGVRLQPATTSTTCPAQAVSVFPSDLDEPQTALVGDRPVRRRGHAAADGDGRRPGSPTAAR